LEAQMIDYDFQSLAGFGDSVMIAVRARQYDQWLREFLAGHRDAVVLNLGCGLDTRVSRIGPPASVRWFDVDFPEVIDLRRKFYADSSSYGMVGTSLGEEAWLGEVPRDVPAGIVAEGVFEYMEAADVKTLLNRLTSYFAQGQVIFDCLSSFAVRSGRTQLETKTGAVHKWAVDDIREVDVLDASLRRIDDLSLFESRYRRKLSWRYRLLFGVASLVPRFRDTHRLLRYEFSA
jgi:O-methyltransferase involved in polyketide biosynthesis